MFELPSRIVSCFEHGRLKALRSFINVQADLAARPTVNMSIYVYLYWYIHIIMDIKGSHSHIIQLICYNGRDAECDFHYSIQKCS